MTTIPAPTNPVDPPELTEVVEAGSTGTSLKFASPEEALAGEETAKMMSPATTKHVLDNTEGGGGGGYPINDGGDGLEELWSANYLTESVGDTAAMLDGILGDGDEIAALKGDDGTTGLSVLSGPYPPTIEGVDGEFWIDTTSWIIYGPKTDGAWGTGTTIKGADGADGVDGTNGTDGADGEDGNTVLSGASDPTTEGVVGDWYINTTSLQIFGPKTSEGWGTGTDLQGADGEDGAIGPTFSISANHFFADSTERDDYFDTNPSELVAGVVISITSGSTGYQQYSGSAWVDKEFAIDGGGSGGGGSTTTSDTMANRPTAGNAGNLFLPTDAIVIQRDDGIEWRSFGPVWPINPPSLDDFEWFGPEGTATDDGDGIKLLGASQMLAKAAVPSSNFRVTVGIFPHMLPINYDGVGLVVANSTSGKSNHIKVIYSGSDWGIFVANYNAGPSYASNVYTLITKYLISPIWLQIEDNGTTREYRWGTNGRDFITLFTTASNAWATADRAGLYSDPSPTSGSTKGFCNHFFHFLVEDLS